MRSFALATILAFIVLAPAARADHHEVLISEIYAGGADAADVEYVELEMLANGENRFVDNQAKLLIFDEMALDTDVAAGPADPIGGAGRTVLFATNAAALAFDVDPDYTLPPNMLDPARGAVCFQSPARGMIDCVKWGSQAGAVPAFEDVGNPASAFDPGEALVRSFAPGCDTLLERGDDTNDSATDFFIGLPDPHPSFDQPQGERCVPPSFTIKGPAKTRDRTPTFRFTPSEPVTNVRCRVDSASFKPCASPYTSRRLKPGRHKFVVRGTDEDATTGSSSKRFRVLKRR